MHGIHREIMVARDVYEVAALLSVKLEDDASFERHVLQAKTYYVDYAGALPSSSRQTLILALNLMRLMVQNRIAEFHTELELIPASIRSDAYIAYTLRLENYLMEGSYSKLREENVSTPHIAFEYFVDKLMMTVREEIAACSARAYNQLPIQSALRLLSLTSKEELAEFGEDHGWRIDGDVIHFAEGGEDGPSMENVPSSELIKRTLDYARELEQII